MNPGHHVGVPEGCPLSFRQWECARRVAVGMTYKEVARERGLTHSGVRSSLHTTYVALGLSGRGSGALAVLLKDSGWLGAPPRAPRVPEPILTPGQSIYVERWEAMVRAHADDEGLEHSEVGVDHAAGSLRWEHGVGERRADPNLDGMFLRLARAIAG